MKSARLSLLVVLASLARIGTASAQVPTTTDPAPSPATLPPSSPEPPPAPAGPSPRGTAPDAGGPVTVPAPSPATPAPSPLEKVTNAVTSLVRPYGTFKPTIDVSVGAIESYGNPNASAPTAAGNPALSNAPKDTRYSFQMAQSRVGIWVAEKSQARAHLEIDFVDFTKASPTVAATPRLRVATVDYEPIEHFVISAGQDWDLYSPVNPFTTNLVGSNFEAGNSGFMRQQVKFIETIPDAVELAFAIGMPAQNASFKDAGMELARVPTFAVRAAAIVGTTGRIGVSGIATQLRQGLGTPQERRTGAYSANVYADIGKADGFQLKAEGYIGRNMNNIGALTLAFGTATKDVDELGGYVSMRQSLAPNHAVYLTVGAAGVLNPENVVPDYAITAGANGAAATRALSGTGPGMKLNMHANVGYEYRPYKPVAILLEPQLFRSRHVLQQADWGKFDPLRTAVGAEASMMYFF